MFYKSLQSINQKLHLNLLELELQNLNTELTILRPNTIASPRYLSRQCSINRDVIETILTELSRHALFTPKFIVYCENDDSELIHAFDFTNKKELTTFLFKNNFTCPSCFSQLNAKDIRVAFLKNDVHLQVL